MFKYSELNTKYGNDVLPKVKEAENLARSYGRHRSHLYFNLQCKHAGIIPKGLKVKYQTNSSQARNIIHKAEFELLNLRIKETIQRKAQLNKRLENVTNELKLILPSDIYTEIAKNNANREQREVVKSSKTQMKKFLKLKHMIFHNL